MGLELEQMDQESLPPFNTATFDSISQCQHTTTSIDIRVSSFVETFECLFVL